MAGNDVPDRIRDLDRRRAWARARAPLWFTVGMVVIALANALLVVVLIASVARLTTWITHDDFTDAGVWDWLPIGIEVVGAAAFVLSLAYLLLHVVSAAPKAVLREVGARPMRDGELTVVRNVVEALAIGLGTTPPELWVVDDPAPNALSVRSWRREVLVVTTGLAEFPRSELEAVCAHELAHLHAVDGRWVSAAGGSVTRAQRYAGFIAALGVFVFIGFLIGLKADAFLPSWLAAGVALTLLGSVAARALGAMNRRIRAESDDVADVVAVHLAKNPLALGEGLDRMARDTRRVRRTGWRSELLWFESMEVFEPTAGEAAATDLALNQQSRAVVDARSQRDLTRRSVAAYATARRERPADVAGTIPGVGGAVAAGTAVADPPLAPGGSSLPPPPPPPAGAGPAIFT